MLTRQQTFNTASIILSSLAVWLYIVTQVQPDKSDSLVMVTFFASLIIWLGSLLAFGLFRYKVKKGNNEVIYAHIKPSIRQGFLVSITLATLLFLQLLHVIGLWDILLVVLVAIIFELALRQQTIAQPKKKRL